MVSWSELYTALKDLKKFIDASVHFKDFSQQYMKNKRKPWNDDTLNGLLSLLGPTRRRQQSPRIERPA